MTTEQKYDLYVALLKEWNAKINLVASGTIADARRRHIDDSAQLAEFIPADKTVVDLGSGAGFPSVVLAILGRRVVAIESVAKKCRFLEELKRRLDLPNLTVLNDRVEAALPRLFCGVGRACSGGFVFTARAFAPMTKILDLTAGFAKQHGVGYVLLKGRTALDEIAQARGKYAFDTRLMPSKTGDGQIVILTIK